MDSSATEMVVISTSDFPSKASVPFPRGDEVVEEAEIMMGNATCVLVSFSDISDGKIVVAVSFTDALTVVSSGCPLSLEIRMLSSVVISRL